MISKQLFDQKATEFLKSAKNIKNNQFKLFAKELFNKGLYKKE